MLRTPGVAHVKTHAHNIDAASTGLPPKRLASTALKACVRMYPWKKAPKTKPSSVFDQPNSVYMVALLRKIVVFALCGIRFAGGAAATLMLTRIA